MTYSQTRKDFESLERIAELSDQVELDAERLPLMENPTKKKAQDMYDSAIHLWFHEHGVSKETKAIAKRYNVETC